MNLKAISTCFAVLLAILIPGSPAPARAAPGMLQHEALVGRWKITFTFASVGPKNLVLDVRSNGDASVLLLDSGPDNKPAPRPLPATISSAGNGRLNVSSEVELPYGTCCREIGTLVFKGTLGSNHSIVGKVVFIGSTEEAENPLGYRTMLGSFSAVRLDDKN